MTHKLSQCKRTMRRCVQLAKQSRCVATSRVIDVRRCAVQYRAMTEMRVAKPVTVERVGPRDGALTATISLMSAAMAAGY